MRKQFMVVGSDTYGRFIEWFDSVEEAKEYIRNEPHVNDTIIAEFIMDYEALDLEDEDKQKILDNIGNKQDYRQEGTGHILCSANCDERIKCTFFQGDVDDVNVYPNGYIVGDCYHFAEYPIGYKKHEHRCNLAEHIEFDKKLSVHKKFVMEEV